MLSIATGKYLSIKSKRYIINGAGSITEQFNELRRKINILSDNASNTLLFMKVVNGCPEGPS